MRAALLLLLAVLVIVGLWQLAGGGGASAPLEVRDESVAVEGADAPVLEPASGADGGRSAAGEASLREALEALAPPVHADRARAPRRVVVFVVTPEGEGLMAALQARDPLARLSIRLGLRPPGASVVLPGERLRAAEAEWVNARTTFTLRDEPGRYTVLEDPPPGSLVVLVHGERLLAAAPVPPPAPDGASEAARAGADRLRLVVDPAQVGEGLAGLTLRLAGAPALAVQAELVPRSGLSGFARMVRLPLQQRGLELSVDRVPPGPYDLVLRPSLDAVFGLMHARAEAQGVGALATGEFTDDPVQWALRSELAADLLGPTYRREVLLEAGATLDLGTLDPPRAGGVELAFAGGGFAGASSRWWITPRGGARVAPLRSFSSPTGLIVLGLPPGEHVLQVESGDGHAARARFTVEAGRVARASATLEPWTWLEVTAGAAASPARAFAVGGAWGEVSLPPADLDAAALDADAALRGPWGCRLAPGNLELVLRSASGVELARRTVELADQPLRVELGP